MEFGATTGRPRRCGWLDVPQLKYTIMLNGVTQLVMTKIDVLDGFEQIKIANAYEIGDQQSSNVPFDICEDGIDPVWKVYEGWNTSLEGIRSYSDLPVLTRNFIEDLENQLGVRFSMISTGPDRSKLITH